MPKKPLSSYIFFSQQIREKIKRQNPNISMTELMKEISNRWSCISDKDKEPYNMMAKNDKLRYEQELMDYKIQVRSYQRGDISKKVNQGNSLTLALFLICKS